MTTPSGKDIQAELNGANDELKAADILLSEKLYSQAVSSSYYAVFHAARAALWNHGKNVKSHRGLVQLFGKEFIKTGKLDTLYSDILTGHKEKREMADYDPVDFNVSREETELIVKDAIEFVRKIESLLSLN